MGKIIILADQHDSLCDRICGICRGGLFVIEKDDWDKICDFVKYLDEEEGKEDLNKYGPIDFGNCAIYGYSDYVDSCQIIDEDPTDEVLNLVENVDIGMGSYLLEILNNFLKKKNKERFTEIVESKANWIQFEKLDWLFKNKQEEKNRKIKRQEDKIGMVKGKFII